MRSKSFSLGLLSLVLFTVCALLAYKYSFNKSLVIDPSSDYKFTVITDASQGGQTTAQLKKTKRAFELSCDIKKAYAWPFCELAVELTEPGQGLDLSTYDTVAIRARFEGEGSQRIRFYVRNSHPDYTKPSNDATLKVNEVEYAPNMYASEVVIPLDNFQVSGWWIDENNVPLEHFATDFSNVPLIEVATGGHVAEGKIKIIVEEIRFDGKMIPETHFLTFIIFIWVLVAISFLLNDVRLARNDLVKTRKQAQELESLTETLKLESKKFEQMAKRDPLTGARNRAGIRDYLFEQVQQVYLNKMPLSIIFMDIDHFKTVNDTHGHETGDEVLKVFARLVTNNTRQSDSLVRWGGEEFLLVCSNTDSEQAEALAENIRAAIEVAEWPLELDVTCSFGVTQMGQEGTSQFIARADEALYKAKSTGRNKVVTF
ncbi:GGDEF domain-containing protein [Motilimonas pumila]|uniref:diguanylate cyclase n=1 Tax=Motilimonas pumila TaxID=2303987 RepID=A0A418YC45_9GAMM|nr:GGDEF domain-containing protein [Motilimonas pumila]RJG42054.1 GGDEF domain-containing protein [Motilimonas pumila]